MYALVANNHERLLVWYLRLDYVQMLGACTRYRFCLLSFQCSVKKYLLSELYQLR